jgi:hypothetical protein
VREAWTMLVIEKLVARKMLENGGESSPSNARFVEKT